MLDAMNIRQPKHQFVATTVTTSLIFSLFLGIIIILPYNQVQSLSFPQNNVIFRIDNNHKKETQVNMSAAAVASSGTRKLIGKLSPSTTSFFLCDIQERFRPKIYNSETIISTSQYLTSVATALSIPIVATQQYTKAFGPTVADCFANGQDGIDALVSSTDNKLKIFEKKKFSMMTDEVKDYYFTAKNMVGRDSIVLFGIEAHVCVQQTCLDLLEMGKDVHVVVDCVSSQQGFDREIALKRMENAGAFMTTAQSLACPY